MECITESNHCPATGMQNGDEALPSIRLADSDWLESCLSGEDKTTTEDYTGQIRQFNNANKSPEERKGTYIRLKQASRSHSTPQTLKWLEENYELAEGVCIPRSTLYVHYLDFCEKHDTQPVNAASFGKIIRQQFPQLTTRRLGTRGQSKYHYYGIGVRESSAYYEVIYSVKGVQSNLDAKKGDPKQIIAYSPRSKLGTLLPEFPDIKDIQLPAEVAEDKVLTFLMMYRAHCQRILDTVIRANFDEVQSFLIHFWQGMPNHIKTILECKVLVTLVGVCDAILYRAIAGVLMPSVLQPLPESLTQVIRKFSGQFEEWLHQALDSLPQTLQKVKFDLARRFSQVLRRQTSLNHLCQAARTVVHSPEITSQMLDDWSNVDLSSIIKQTLYTMDNYSDREHNVMVKLTGEFEVLLEDQAPLESYIEWLDAMMDQCVTQKGNQLVGKLRTTARQFLLMWSCFGTRIIRDMTLHSAPSFGSFHLLHLMFDEYVLYMVENLHCQERGNELLRAVRGQQNLDFLDEMIVSDTNGVSVDRSSVIRGPSTPQQIVEFSAVPDCSPLHEGNNDTLLQNTYRDTASTNTKYHSSFRNNSNPAGTFCNQFGYYQCPSRSTNSNDEIANQTAIRSSSSIQPFPGYTKQISVETAGSTVSNWYEWSSRPINCTGMPNHVSSSRPMSCSDFPNHVASSRAVSCAGHPSRLQSTETFPRQVVPVSCQSDPNQNVVSCDSNAGMMNYVPYSNDSLKRYHVYGETVLTKRKLQHNVQITQNKQLENFYSYNSGTNLV